MNAKDATKNLIRYWSEQRYLQTAAGLSNDEICKFATDNNVKIPSDLAEYLRFANGFRVSDRESDLTVCDDEGFEFHALSVKRLINSKYFIFCSWPLGFIEYAICLDKLEKNGVVIKLVDEAKGYFLSENFSDFVGFYLSNSERLYAAGDRVISL